MAGSQVVPAVRAAGDELFDGFAATGVGHVCRDAAEEDKSLTHHHSLSASAKSRASVVV